MANFNSLTSFGAITDTELNGGTAFTPTFYEDSVDSMFKRRWNLDGFGGTMATIVPSGAPHVHSASKPAYVEISRGPKMFALPPANSAGKRPTPPMNIQKVSARWLATCDADGTSSLNGFDGFYKFGAGSETYDMLFNTMMLACIRAFLTNSSADLKSLNRYGRIR